MVKTETEKFFPTQGFLASHCIERTVEKRRIYYVDGNGTVLVNGGYIPFAAEVAAFKNDPHSKASKLRFMSPSQKDLVTLVSDQAGHLGVHLATWDAYSPSLTKPDLLVTSGLRGQEIARLSLRPGVNATGKRTLISADDVVLDSSEVRKEAFQNPAQVVDFLLGISQSIANFK